ncbi:MAG: hypothetical protein HYZ42_12715 [Bacteroidetes bacterium]|nr:hypothetical protein [Bacteroidota bacterium]
MLILIYEVGNYKSKEEQVKPKSGIGYKNLRRRLDLLYKDNYEINSHFTDETYKATLKITLPNNEN